MRRYSPQSRGGPIDFQGNSAAWRDIGRHVLNPSGLKSAGRKVVGVQVPLRSIDLSPETFNRVFRNVPDRLKKLLVHCLGSFIWGNG